ncbi:MAG: selenocysteine-specific translation elongation factor [Acidobacteria bacterium]|nr:selenocysteine-specific translation elongation factor [Acidobacteriota bacterium]
MKSIIVGTAGHIDHGKSALVRALTGTDPDRLEEEKRRGITIDIGFATLDLGQEYRLGFVDVPGHERFVKNMLAGVGGIDLLLLVIAADQSIQPQTREHFDICRLLEIPRGIVVITKSDLVDQDSLDLVKLDAEEFVAGSFLDGAPMVAVSSRTGAGLDELREVLRRAAAEVPAKDASRHFRLPIDRSFVMKGFGPVITGTLVSGRVRKDAEVEAYPIGKRLRVRGIQVHGKAVEEATAGQRTALNLTGVEAGELERGMTLASPGRFVPTRRIDARLHLLPSAPALKNGAQVHFHAGTAEIIATAVCLETAQGSTTERRVEPGQSAWVQFRLRQPALLLPGDHFIIRKFSPLLTIGGGRVLDNWSPPLSINPRAARAENPAMRLAVLEKGTQGEILMQLLKGATGGSLGIDDLIARTGWLAEECRQAMGPLQQARQLVVLAENPLRVADAAPLQAFSEAVLEALGKFHLANPLLPGTSIEAIRTKVLARAHPLIAEKVLQQLALQNQIVVTGETIRLAAHKIVLTQEEDQARQQIARSFERAGLTVPAVNEVLGKLPMERRKAEKILQLLIQDGTLVRVSEDLVFHSGALRKLLRLLAQYKSTSDRISVSTFKDLAQLSRKYAIPLLEYLDRERVTRRSGDDRILL